MISEMIVLAGGLGTRLRAAVPDLPKCMAPLQGRPFLHYLLDHFHRQGVQTFIFSLGYKHEAITQWLASEPRPFGWTTVVENEPLGTGGAIRLACSRASGQHVLVANGDSFFAAALEPLSALHLQKNSACTLALKPMRQFDRYGVVETDAAGRISAFREKQPYAEGHINGGLYALDTRAFLSSALPERFSFEKDFLEAHCAQMPMYGLVQEAYFIDIGIPEDYARAQAELPAYLNNH